VTDSLVRSRVCSRYSAAAKIGASTRGGYGWEVRTLLYAALVCAIGCVTSCSGGPTTPTSTTVVSTRTNPTVGPDPSPTSDGVLLDCGRPTEALLAPWQGYNAVLDAVAFDTRILPAAGSGGGNDPHRHFAKTGLLVHAGRTATLVIPQGWTDRVSIAWGNHAAEWTTTLHIPACPATPAGEDRWLAYPGGFSLDTPACIPLEVHTGDQVTTIRLAVGAACP
jgi:hypothetical protein